ncbi:MAG TPA: SH3 domain-containing protein, partial [Anaeromyxobacter sp.]
RARVAIVVAAEAPVREGPEVALRPAFTLREGAPVEVVDARGDVLRVRLGSGLEGWVRARDLEEL